MPKKRGLPLDIPVGGFFPLHPPSPTSTSIFDLWGLGGEALCLSNARSALAEFLNERGARRVWLPSYICESIVEGAAASRASISFYPVHDTLEPDVAFLDRKLRTRDYVLAVDYFGRTPDIQFRRLVAMRRDVHWIEDRAHALDVGSALWGRWQLFSPRKLLGVPDGGVVVGPTTGSMHAQPHLAPPQMHLMLRAQTERMDDPYCYRSEQWFALYRQSERQQKVGKIAMSPLSLAILKACGMRCMRHRRRANWHILDKALGHLAALRRPPGVAPFGFVVRVRDAAGLQGRLVEQGVFAQRHWARLPSPRRLFSQAHRLANELLTLPCDHRYGAREMHEIIRVVRKCLD